MDSLERMDVQNVSKEVGRSKLTYSSNIPAIKPVVTLPGIVLIYFFVIYLIFCPLFHAIMIDSIV